MTVDHSSCRMPAARPTLRLLAIIVILVNPTDVTIASTRHGGAQRAPRGLSLGDTIGPFVADGASKVSDINPLVGPRWPDDEIEKENVNYSSSAHCTDYPLLNSAPAPTDPIDHMRATTARPGLDKSSLMGATTSRWMSTTQLNHVRARRATLTSGVIVGPPKLVQWSREPVQYHEGSTLALSCSLSYAGGEQAPLKFAWFKQGKPLAMTYGSQAPKHSRLSIETRADYSFLRQADLRPADSGAYTCVVSNSLNQEDRTTALVLVNVKLKWLAGAPGSGATTNSSSITVGNGHQIERARAGQSVAFECNAAGGDGSYSKPPRVRWFRLMPTAANTVADVRRAGLAHSDSTTYVRYAGVKQKGGSNQRADPARSLDEAYLRSILIQLDSVIGNRSTEGHQSFRRIELVEDNNSLVQHSYERLATNESHPEQFRWRIETNKGAQHEVYSRLVLDRLYSGTGGLYECEVVGFSQNAQQFDNIGLVGATASGDKLRRVFGLLVNVIADHRRREWFINLP